MADLVSRGSTKEIGIAYLGRGAEDLDSEEFNKTRGIISNLVLDKVVQVRYMHIAFGCISIALAIWIVGRIWFDSWRASKLQVKLRQRKFDFLYDLHPAESFPLILGLVIIIQMVSFVSIQAAALQTVFVRQCRVSSQLVLTQIFITGYLHLVFGLEMTIRSLKTNRFAPRRRYTTSVCVFVALILTLLTWLSTRIRPPKNKCFGDMIWRSIRSATFGIFISSILISSFLIMASIIANQLYRTARVNQNERIAGTRMVYYLVLSAILYILILPFWIQARLQTFDSSLTSSRVAEFVLFISGSAIAFVHMFLRANAARTAIKPKTAPWHERRRFRLCGVSDLELMNISSPIIDHSSYRPDEKVADIWARQQAEKDLKQAKFESLSSPGFTFPLKAQTTSKRRPSWPLPEEAPLTPPKGPNYIPKSPTGDSRSQPGHKRNQESYSLFPGSIDLRLPATTYAPNSKIAPPPKTPAKSSGVSNAQAAVSKFTSPSVTDVREASLQPPTTPWLPSHRRTSSTTSSATVQIGIRFSTAPAAVAATVYRRSSSQNLRRPSMKAVMDTTSPIQSQSKMPTFPLLIAPTSAPAQSRLESPFNPEWDFPQSPESNKQPRQSEATTASDFAWLDTADEASPKFMSPLRQKSKNRPKATRESNRYEIDALQRSASARSRQGYQPPTTPERGSTGFF